VTVYAPEFLDVITVDEKLVGLFPNFEAQLESLPRLRPIGAWSFTRRPVSLFVKTSPRPAQIAASVATTVRVEPEVVRQSAVVTWDIRNAGIDTVKISVPEAVASDVRFQTLSAGHVIQQRDKAAAENGWVPWTLILQNETTGTVQIGVDWDVPLAATATVAVPAAAAPAAETAGQSLTIEPPRVLAPFADEQADRRRVTLTQTRGEIRLLRHESLSIDAESRSEVTEAVDVRELELLEQDGYLAYRYFAQPASATIRIRKHELHEVAATVVSRAAIEIVTERQRLATIRAQYRITTSERQRLRIDLPANADLQAPLLNDQRTTIEKATDVRAVDKWEAYYVNISRPGTSDQEFLLTLQFRCAIVDESDRPYVGRGRDQKLRLPLPGDDTGSTVVQQMQVAVWAPDDVVLLGNPDLWTQEGAVLPPVVQPLRSVSSTAAAAQMRQWVTEGFPVSGDFPTQGTVSVYRAVGRQPEIQVTWWNRPFLFWMISGTLAVIGLILRKTSWENRITAVLLAALAVALLSVRPSNTVPQLLSMAWPGLMVVGGIWVGGLLLGQQSGRSSGTPLVSPPPEAPAVTTGPPAAPPAQASPASDSTDATGGAQ
jgi:hypothetical protein